MLLYCKKYYYDHENHHHIEKLEKIFGSKIMKKEELRLIKRVKSKLLFLLCLSFLSCSFIWMSQIFGFPVSLSFLHDNIENSSCKILGSDPPIAPSPYNGSFFCDRSHFRTDICFLKGDIRTHSSSSTIFLYTNPNPKYTLNDIHQHELQHETIRPYTRKWETSIMNTIDELHLIIKHKSLSNSHQRCDVLHKVPAIFFSTGGYTGNVYHEFNDGIIPLYITSRKFDKEVIFVILEYHSWWYTKYSHILAQLSNYPLIDFTKDSKTHCFSEAIVGLKIHDELTIDPSLVGGSSSKANILGFRDLLHQALEAPNGAINVKQPKNKPRMVLLSRNGSRSITNEHSIVRLAQKIGFSVQILKPTRKTQLSTMYKAISSSDVMVGVHGAAMTHFLFLKPNRVFIQVIPLGTEWASETYYGEPAKKFGLKYIGYKIDPKESSLYYKYDKDDVILRDPNGVNKKGWEYTKKYYLDDQNVTLDLKKFHKLLLDVYGDLLH